MPTCMNCGRKWSWLNSLKKISSFRKSMKCSHCGEIQYQSSSSRNVTSLLVLLPIITIPISALFNLNLIHILLFNLSLFAVVILLIPYFLKLSNKDEPLW